jgi:hypothetical protein
MCSYIHLSGIQCQRIYVEGNTKKNHKLIYVCNWLHYFNFITPLRVYKVCEFEFRFLLGYGVVKTGI